MKKIIFTTMIITTLFSCVNDDDYGRPNDDCIELTVNTSIQDVRNLANSSPQLYDMNPSTEDVLEAYITSSDEGGNFYKSISLISTDGTKAFTIPIDDYNLYTKFEPGRKVFVHLDSLYFHYNSQISSLEVGDLYNNDTPLDLSDDEVGRIPTVKYKSAIIRSCTKVSEEDIIKNVTIQQAKDNQYLNMLIEFDNVQFTETSLNHTYFDSDLNAVSTWTGTNHNITDEFGNTIYLRASKYASFASSQIPNGNGKIRGVLTKYNNDYQLLIRTLNDVQLTNTRVEIDYFPPLVGSSLVYSGTLNEPFTSYTNSNQQNFPAYINDASIGNRYWQVKQYPVNTGNRYIQMSSFGGGNIEANRALFIVPVNMTTANTFSFKTKDGYNNGNVLKVYYSTNYVPGNQISTATLVDITSNFTISSGNTSGYGANFINSGTYNIPASLTGNGYFIFEYVGNGSTGPTTTMQIDDIVVN